MARIEPYFNVIINAANEVMIVIKNRAKDPVNPEFYFDGYTALLRRGNETDIVLTKFGDVALRAIANVPKVMVVETASGQLTFKKNRKGEVKFREKLLQTYDVQVRFVETLPDLPIENPKLLKDKKIGQQDTGIVKFSLFGWLFDRIVISLCWIVMFVVIGIVLQQFQDNKYYDVKADSDPGMKIVQKYNIKYKPKHEFRIFWTSLYRSSEGVFVMESHLEELDAYEYSEIPDEKVKKIGLAFEIDDWDEEGWQLLLIGFGFLAFIGSFLPFEVFNILGQTVESM